MHYASVSVQFRQKRHSESPLQPPMMGLFQLSQETPALGLDFVEAVRAQVTAVHSDVGDIPDKLQSVCR